MRELIRPPETSRPSHESNPNPNPNPNLTLTLNPNPNPTLNPKTLEP